MFRSRILPVLALSLVTAALIAPSAQADIVAKSGKAELYLGWMFPENDISGQSLDDFTWAVRGGYHFTPHLSLLFSAQKFHTDIDTVGAEVDVDQLFLDVPVVWSFNPDSKSVFQVWGGVGYAIRDFDFAAAGTVDDDADALSLNFGLGSEIAVTEKFYIRPETSGRWLEGNDAGTIEDGIDWQVGVGFGWYIGR